MTNGFDIRFRRQKTKFGSSCHYIHPTDETPDVFGFCPCAYYKADFGGKQYGQYVLGPMEQRSILDGPSKEMIESVPKFAQETKRMLRIACAEVLRTLRKKAKDEAQ